MDDQNNPPPASPQVSNTTSPTPPAKSGLPKIVLILLLVPLIVLMVAVVGLGKAKKEAKEETAELKSQLVALQSNVHELPEGAVKVSDCIPNMGAHYIPKDAEPPYGPFLLVNKAGKVIGVEFMASEDMYTPIPGVVPPVEVLTKNSSLYGWKFDHAELSHTPEGHEGFLKDHIDVHLYTVTPEQQKQACV